MNDSEVKNILEEESLSQESQKAVYDNKLDKKLTQIKLNDEVRKFSNTKVKEYSQKFG
jgi:hypothetical protein